MYPLCIHYVSIPHIQYNTYIYISITALHTQCNLNTYALPAYQPDDSPLPPVRSSRHNREKQNNQNPQQAACPLAESGVNRYSKRATKLLYCTRKLVVGVVSLVSVARYTFDSFHLSSINRNVIKTTLRISGGYEGI